MTREEWLNKAAAVFAPDFAAHSKPLPPNFRISCGFPSQGALARKRRRAAECWKDEASEDGHFEIFISPLSDDPHTVIGHLVHELCHVACQVDKSNPHFKHGKPFKEIAVKMGLEGKMTATTPSQELCDVADRIVKTIGKYPHAKIVPVMEQKKQGTRMLKVECPDCGYTLRTTRKWIEVGLPTCCCGTDMTYEEPEE